MLRISATASSPVRKESFTSAPIRTWVLNAGLPMHRSNTGKARSACGLPNKFQEKKPESCRDTPCNGSRPLFPGCMYRSAGRGPQRTGADRQGARYPQNAVRRPLRSPCCLLTPLPRSDSVDSLVESLDRSEAAERERIAALKTVDRTSNTSTPPRPRSQARPEGIDRKHCAVPGVCR